jgi:hypothetical protein
MGDAHLHAPSVPPEAAGYVRVSKKPVGDLASAYQKTRPDWRNIVKAPEYHTSAYLLEGLEENYRGLGVVWPANRYADVKGRNPCRPAWCWRCRHDLQTGKFDVPALFSADNATAVVSRVSGAFDCRNIRLGANTR